MSSNIKYLYLILIALAMFSCKKDEDYTNITPIYTPKEKIVNNLVQNLAVRDGEGLDLGCFAIQFPFSMVTATGNVTFNNEAEFEAATSTTTGLEVIDFVYPLTVVQDGEYIVVNNLEEISNLYAACVPEGGWGDDKFPAYLLNYDNSCYAFVYPVNLVSENGETFTATNEAQLSDLLAANQLLFFSWPLNVVKADGAASSANNSDELFQLLLQCDNIPHPWDSLDYKTIGCFDIVFPISFVEMDGSIVTANNLSEMTSIILGGNIAGFSFPINISSISTGQISVESDERLQELMYEHCNVFVPEGDLFYVLTGTSFYGGTCYEINFPLTIDDGTVTGHVVNTFEEIKDFMASNPNPAVGVIYPVSVTLISTNEVVSIDDQNELLQILADCQ